MQRQKAKVEPWVIYAPAPFNSKYPMITSGQTGVKMFLGSDVRDIQICLENTEAQ